MQGLFNNKNYMNSTGFKFCVWQKFIPIKKEYLSLVSSYQNFENELL